MTVNLSSGETIAEKLARFVVALQYDDIPSPIIDSTKTLILDQLGCELVGSTVHWVSPALKLARLTKGVKAESTVVNHGDRFLVADTAFVNATFGQACEMDDGAFGSGGHIATATVPVALSVGERERIDGRQFLTAMVAGYEVMYRLVRSIHPHAATHGFHNQTTIGPFAGAAVTGKILGFDQERMLHALAICGSHSGGSTEYDQSGGSVKRIHAGLAARAGVQSALLAAFGLTGPSTIVEGKRGICRLFTEHGDPSRVDEELGRTFHATNACFKMYPTVGSVQTTLTALGRMIVANDIHWTQVERVDVGMSRQNVLHGTSIRQPQDETGAQFSLAYSVALAFLKRSHDLSLYMDSKLWSDPDVLDLMGRVSAHADPESHGKKHRRATVKITLKDGQSFEAIEDYLRGTPLNPASPEELDAKVRGLAAAVLAPEAINEMIAMVRNLEGLGNIGDLVRLLVRPGH